MIYYGVISNTHRMFNKLLAFTIVCGLFLLLTGCGGGAATTEEIAQHDADVQAMQQQQKTMTIQPVSCNNGVCK